MIRHYNDVLGVSAAAFSKEGAFNGIVGIDSQFHIDPRLLTVSSAPELANSYQRFTNYFENIIRMLDASDGRRDAIFRSVARKLKFPEIADLWLGYSQKNNSGSGIGPVIAVNLAHTAYEIVKAGIQDPVLFELVPLLEEGIGADRISDMTAQIILHDLAAFSERVARNLDLPRQTFPKKGKWFDLPFDKATRKPIILVPQDILRPLPIAFEWADIDHVVAYNHQLRESLNDIIGRTWQEASSNFTKSDLRAILLGDENKNTLRKLIKDYKEKPPQKYDFLNDPDGILKWHELSKRWAGKYPLDLSNRQSQEIEEIVLQICRHFGRLVQYYGLNESFYDNAGNQLSEIFAKHFFFGMADVYCDYNNLDLTREANIEGQPVDFKISRGRKAIVQVYVKFTTNSHLVNLYEKALESYREETRPLSIVFVIIRTTQEDNQSPKLRELYSEAINKGKDAPKLVFTDGRHNPIQQYNINLGNTLEEIQIRFGASSEKSNGTSSEKSNGATNENQWNRFTEQRRERARLVKEFKEANPEWSQPKVAMEVQERLDRSVTKDDVVNDYRDMKKYGLIDWDWQKANRIR